MKTNLKVMIVNDRFMLRSVEQNDAEILRLWKNTHKEFFFYKQEIQKVEQQEWINSLANRQNDHLFIVMDKNNPVGCIGTRLYQEFVDIYNVILGDKNYKGVHVMTNAVWATIAFSNLVFNNKPVRVRVLRNNPAIKWYEKIGFNNIDFFDDHIVMQFRDNIITESYDFNIAITLPLK